MSCTQGPWRVSTNQDEPEIISELHTTGLAHFMIVPEGAGLGDISDDANLIAAAPDLYAALVAFLEYAEEPPNRNCSCHIAPPCGDCVEYSGMREVFENVRAAMKKARGGQ